MAIKLNLNRLKDLKIGSKDRPEPNPSEPNQSEPNETASGNFLQRIKGNIATGDSQPETSHDFTPPAVTALPNINLTGDRPAAASSNLLLQFFKSGFTNPHTRNRLFQILGLSLLASTIPTLVHYNHYYNQEAPAARKADLDLLSRSLPIKLSQALSTGEENEIVQTLNSSAGKHNLVITSCTQTTKECSQEKVIYATGGQASGQAAIAERNRAEEKFDVLVSPPGVLTRKIDLESLAATIANKPKQIRAIGRLYYLDSPAPNFFEGYINWLLKPSAGNMYYPLYTLLFLCGGGAAWLVLTAMQREYQHILTRAKELQQKLDSDCQRNRQIIDRTQLERSELAKYQAKIVDDKSTLSQQLEHHQTSCQRQEVEIEHLKNALAIERQEAGGDTNQQIAIERLETSIQRRLNNITASKAALTDLKTSLGQVSNQEGNVKVAMDDIDRRLNALQSEEREARHTIERLSALSNSQNHQNWQELQTTVDSAINQLDRNSRAIAPAEGKQFSIFDELERERRQQSQQSTVLQGEDRSAAVLTANSIQTGGQPLDLNLPRTDGTSIDLGRQRLAIVGGSSQLHGQLRAEFANQYNLREIEFIANHERLDAATLAGKLEGCDTIAIVNKDITPELRQTVANLQQQGRMPANPLEIEYRSTDRIVSAIVDNYTRRQTQKTIPLAFGQRLD
jgi:archaellum component FlaC